MGRQLIPQPHNLRSLLNNKNLKTNNSESIIIILTWMSNGKEDRNSLFTFLEVGR